MFSDNTVTGSYDLGVSLSADFNVLRNNTISNNRVNFEVSSFNNEVDQSNTINGKPIVYWVGHHDETVPSNAGYVVLANCNNIQVHDLDVESIAIVSTVNSLITGNKITKSNNSIQPVKSEDMRFLVPRISMGYGIQLIGSSNDVVSLNFVSGKDYGVKLTDSTGIKVLGNNITSNTYYGMMLKNSNNNIIEGNSIVSNGFVTGIFTQGDAFGVSISDSSFNRFVGNYVKANNFWGIRVLGTQQGNVIYHNNFIDNQVREGGLQVSMMGPANPSVWDNGKEGNYWSDYRTRYPNASEVDGSGVGDTPFYINVNNQDNYPLMAPFDISVYVQQSPSPSPTTSPAGSPSPSPSQSASASQTPQSSASPQASPSASQLPAGSPEPRAGSVVPWELVLVAAMVAVVVAVVLVLVFGLRRRK